MSYGPNRDYKSNNYQEKACDSVCRITRNIVCPDSWNRTRFLAVQTTIRVKMLCDKETLIVEETLVVETDTSKKRNLMLVGGHSDNVVDLCGEGNVDTKRQCLGKGQTMLTIRHATGPFPVSPVPGLDDEVVHRYRL